MAKEQAVVELKRDKPCLTQDRTPVRRSAKASPLKAKNRKSKVSSYNEAIKRVISDIKNKHSTGGVRVHVSKMTELRNDFSTKSIFKSVYDKDGVLSVDLVADQFGLSKGQLAETVGVNREALYKTSRAAAPKTQNRIREMVEIIERIKEWAGGKDQAMA
jgi:AraC-like DNA-binding protein